MARFKFAFWLDARLDDDLLLMEDIDGLKAQRGFSRAIRDGLRLVQSLRQGDTSVLLALFPRIGDMLLADTPANAEFKALLERQAAILERIAAGDRALTPPLDMPPDVSLFVDAAPDVSPADARQNFAAGMGNLFDGDDDDLWDD